MIRSALPLYDRIRALDAQGWSRSDIASATGAIEQQIKSALGRKTHPHSPYLVNVPVVPQEILDLVNGPKILTPEDEQRIHAAIYEVVGRAIQAVAPLRASAAAGLDNVISTRHARKYLIHGEY